jgi:hypothetical protein
MLPADPLSSLSPGKKQASVIVATNLATTATNVTGSLDVTPKSKDCKTRVSAIAHPMPTMIPNKLRESPLLRMKVRIDARLGAER